MRPNGRRDNLLEKVIEEEDDIRGNGVGHGCLLRCRDRQESFEVMVRRFGVGFRWKVGVLWKVVAVVEAAAAAAIGRDETEWGGREGGSEGGQWWSYG